MTYTQLNIPYKLNITGVMTTDSTIKFSMTRGGTFANEITIGSGASWTAKEVRNLNGYNYYWQLPSLDFNNAALSGTTFSSSSFNAIIVNGGTLDLANITVNGNGGNWWNGGTIRFRDVTYNAQGLSSVADTQFTTQSGTPTLDIIGWKVVGGKIFIAAANITNFKGVQPAFMQRGFGTSVNDFVLQDFVGGSGNYGDLSAYANPNYEARNLGIGTSTTYFPWISGNHNSRGTIRATSDIDLVITNNAGSSVSSFISYLKDNATGAPTGFTANNYYINTATSGTLSQRILIGVLVASGGVAASFVKRSATQTNDLYAFTIFDYNHNILSTQSFNLAGTGVKTGSAIALVDNNVTLTQANAIAKLASSFTVNTSTNTITVTANSTLDDLYDAMKAYKCTATQANLEYPTLTTQPVTASGTAVATAMNVVVNSGVTLSSGTKFTSLSTSGTFTSAGVIATAIVGSVTTTGTFASGASVTGSVSQATPTNLSGVTITGSLTYNSAAATVTFTNCNVSGTISNSGAGLVKVVKAGTTPWMTAGTNVSVIATVVVETPGGLALSTYIIKNGATDLGWVATTAARSLEIQQSDTFSIYAIAYGYKAKVVSASASDLTSFKFELLPEPFIDTSLSTSIRNTIAAKFSTSFDAYNRIALSLDSDLRAYDPNEVMNAVQYFITTQGSLIAQGVIYGGSVDQVQIINGGILIGTPGFYGKVNDSVTTVNDLGILVPIFVDVLPSVYVTDPTFTPVKKNTSGIILQTAPWTQQTADISAVDKTDIRSGLAREATLALKADQATVAAIPTNPLLATDSRLSRLDVNVSSRLAAADFSSSAAPTSAQNAAAVRSELATELGRIDAAVSSRLAASSYTAPTTPPTSAEVAAAVRTELTTELARIDAAVTSRLAAAAYTAPGTAPTSAQNAQAVRTELAAELARIDAAVSSRLAASGYTAPGPVPTSAQNAAAVRSELALELARLDAAVSSRLAAASYTAPGTAPTSAEVAAAVRTELAAELARLDVASSTRLAASAYTPPDNASITAIKNNTGLIPALF